MCSFYGYKAVRILCKCSIECATACLCYICLLVNMVYLETGNYSLILIAMLDIIAAKPPVVMPEEKMFLIASGNCIRISG